MFFWEKYRIFQDECQHFLVHFHLLKNKTKQKKQTKTRKKDIYLDKILH